MSAESAVELHTDPHASEHGDLQGQKDDYGEATNGKIAMWIFLLSDAFSFGGLLLAYGILRGGTNEWHHVEGHNGWAFETEPKLGINFTAGLTFLLICSSVTMVLAYASAVEKNRKMTLVFLGLTIL